MVIVLWSGNTASWNESIPGCALWIIFSFLKKLSAAFITEGKALGGAGVERRGAREWVFLLLLPLFLLPAVPRQISAMPGAGIARLFSGFYWFLLSPLFSVLLTEVVHYRDVGCAERCLAALTPGSQAVWSTSVLHYGGPSVTNGLPNHVTSRTSHKHLRLGFLICEPGDIVAYTS